MVNPPPHWYPDPTTRHELRYWDGARWTDHVASAGNQQTDSLTAEPLQSSAVRAAAGSQSGSGGVPNRDRRRAPVLGWLGLLLCGTAVVALTVPGVGYLRAVNGGGVRLGGGPQHLVVPAHRTYGIFVDDADNSGYSESCSAVDEVTGRQIQMRDPGWSISSSDTEVLDIVFNTGTGRVSISCSVPGERVTVRPVPRYAAMVLGVAVSGILGVVGAGLLIAWAVIRFALDSKPRGTPAL